MADRRRGEARPRVSLLRRSIGVMHLLLAGAFVAVLSVWLQIAFSLDRGAGVGFADPDLALRTPPLTLLSAFAVIVVLYSWRPHRRLPLGASIIAVGVVGLAGGNILDKLAGVSALGPLEEGLGGAFRGEVSSRFGWNTGLTLGLVAASQLVRRKWGAIGVSLAALAPLLPLSALIGHFIAVKTYFGDMAIATVVILTPIWAANLLSFSPHPVFRVLLMRSDLGSAGRRLVLFAFAGPVAICAGIVLETMAVGLDQVVVLFALAMGWISVFLVLKVLRLQLDKDAERAAHLFQLSRMAVTDSLTGLSNRAGVPLAASNLLRSAAILLLDLDKFKLINDTYGHETGDRVLIAAAREMEAQLRGSDVIARWGGEEFLAVLRDISYDEALGVAERLRRAVSRVEIPEHPEVSVTASIGVAVVLEGEQTIEGAIGRADQALYAAKEQGRNVVIEAAVENNVVEFRPVQTGQEPQGMASGG